MTDTTVIFYTDHSVSEPLRSACINHLKESACNHPIVSISFDPIDLGENIAIGQRQRSWLMLYKQLYMGVKVARTKYVAMAEHDCFYTDEHFAYIPEKDDTFFYNENHWLVQYADNSHPELKGMYSRYWQQRLALSQMICNRDLLEETLRKRLALLDEDAKLVREIVFAGEPGLSKLRLEKARRWAKSGKPVYLKQYLQDQLDSEKYGVFKTKIPNLDVRHDNNFTGPKRGRKRTFEVEYWGRFEDLMSDQQGERLNEEIMDME